MGKRGMRIKFQPYVHAEIRQRAHRRSKTDRRANAACPVGGIARFASATLPRHRAEEWDGVGLRPEAGQLSFQRLRGRSHQRMVKRMIYPNESGKGTLRLEFRCHRLERKARARKCDRPWSVESGNRYRSIVTRNESQSFIFGQP